MGTLSIFQIILAVLSNPIVIISTAIIFLYLNFVSYVARYRKRSSHLTPKKASPKEEPAPEAKVEDADDDLD